MELADSGVVRTRVGLNELTSYRLGGPATYFAEVEDRAGLSVIAAALATDPQPVLVLGRGSNLVISDRGFDGLVLRLGHGFGAIGLEPDGSVSAGGWAPLPQVARLAAAGGRRGLEFLIGVPGSTGGGVRQNAGCFGLEIADVLETAELCDLTTGLTRVVPGVELDMSYRRTNIATTEVVIGARLRATPGDANEGLALIREHTRWRRLHQPGGTLNAGSVFKNPPGQAAGAIIDRLGLKGYRIGGASVSEKHANFFVAIPGTRALDVYLLTREVARIVQSATGIELEPEIQFVGDFDEGTGA